jgi:hypothetical protein
MGGSYRATDARRGDPLMILGGRVLHDILKAEIMGTPFDAIGHTGYDNVAGKYWSIWFDNLSTGMSTLEGTVDGSTGKATLVGGTPEAMAGKKVTMRLEIYMEDGKQVSDTNRPLPGKGTVMTMKFVSERQ